jgi:hypothetical protein
MYGLWQIGFANYPPYILARLEYKDGTDKMVEKNTPLKKRKKKKNNRKKEIYFYLIMIRVSWKVARKKCKNENQHLAI